MSMFKKIAIGLLFCAPTVAFAQTFACQFTHSAGMAWRSGTWQPTKFKMDAPFFLKTLEGNITSESAAKVMGTKVPQTVSCHPSIANRVFCSTGTLPQYFASGTSLIFDTKTMRGAISEILGGISDKQDYRDSLSVSAFVCQQMTE
jgi:hypothetical protein